MCPIKKKGEEQMKYWNELNIIYPYQCQISVKGFFWLHCCSTCMFLVLFSDLHLSITVSGIVCTCLITVLCVVFFCRTSCMQQLITCCDILIFFPSLPVFMNQQSVAMASNEKLKRKGKVSRPAICLCTSYFLLFLLYFNDFIFIFLSFPPLFLCVYRHVRCNFF